MRGAANQHLKVCSAVAVVQLTQKPISKRKALSKIIPVILSGGSGTRLWPLSRKQYPKQYLPLAGDNTMLQETILRLEGLDNLADPIIICNTDHRFLVAE